MTENIKDPTQKKSGKRRFHLSLQMRFVSFVLLVSLIPLIILSTRDIFQTQSALVSGSRISLEAGAAQTANTLDNFIQNSLDTIGVEAQLAEFVNYLTMSPAARTGFDTRDRAKALVVNLSKKNPHVISYGLVDDKGNIILDSASDAQANESGEPYFSRAQVSNLPIVTSVTYLDDKVTSITFASRVLSTDGAYIGILRAKYNATVLQDTILNSVGASPDISVVLLDPLNIRIADSLHPELIQKSIVPLKNTDYALAVESRRFKNIPAEEQATNFPTLEAALINLRNKPFFNVDLDPNTPGDDTVAVAFMTTQPWVVLYSRPTSLFLADVQQQIRINIILVLVTSIILAIIAALVARSLTSPIMSLAKVADRISQGDLNARTDIKSTDEIGVLALAFNTMTNRLQSTLVGLEQRVEERTADLQRSTLELETIAAVTREISIIHDVDTLLKVSVELIRDRFKYYHVAIFLMDERNEFVILRAASGAAAERLLGENYKLRVGQVGVVGNVTRSGQAHFTTDASSFNNPLLPETQSEIALPLRSHNITIGALDIHAKTQDEFSEKDIRIFQTLADQLAAAIENAQLSQRIEGSLAALTTASRMQTQQVWRDAIEQREHSSYEYDGLQIRAVPQHLPGDLLRQLEHGKPIVVKDGNGNGNGNGNSKTTLLVPLTVLDQVIGVIGLEREDPNHTWTEEELAIAQAAATRAGLTLENARLLEESQRRAVKERAIFEATARIGSAINIENILQTTAEELEKVLSGSEVILQFHSENEKRKE